VTERDQDKPERQRRKQAGGVPRPSGRRKTRDADSLEPQQERSRESLRRLRRAAAEVLGQHGIEGATIPRIAAHAGLTPGAIYRRFSDKDALIESVIMDIFARQDKGLQAELTQEMGRHLPLAVFAEQIVHSLLVNYRARAGLLRAMRQFVQSRRGTSFWRKLARLEKRSYERLVDLLLMHAEDIRHPEPRMAVALGMMMVISTLHEVVVNTPDAYYWKDLLPRNDQSLKRELTRGLLDYLGVDRPPRLG
jgi:AcrR family transcriptional regulator